MPTDNERLNTVLKDAGVTKTVYALVMPETESVIDTVIGNEGTSSREAFHHSYREAWTQKQDAVHEKFFDVWQNWTSPIVEADWTEFPFQYPVNGASEAIREAIYAYGARRRASGKIPRIHVFDGEYEGFSAYAQAAGITVISHNRADWEGAIPRIEDGEEFYISQPSAIDGYVWDEFDSFAEQLQLWKPDARLMLDLTYVGCVARDFHVKADHPNIPVVFFSLSKPAGAYYHRIGGMLSREAYPGLFGNKWFKNLMALKIGTSFMETYGVQDLPKKYAPIQAQAAIKANRELGLELRPADVFLLATQPYRGAERSSELEKYLCRGSESEKLTRVCLTPTMAHTIDPKLNPEVQARPHEGIPNTMPQPGSVH